MNNKQLNTLFELTESVKDDLEILDEGVFSAIADKAKGVFQKKKEQPIPEPEPKQIQPAKPLKVIKQSITQDQPLPSERKKLATSLVQDLEGITGKLQGEKALPVPGSKFKTTPYFKSPDSMPSEKSRMALKKKPQTETNGASKSNALTEEQTFILKGYSNTLDPSGRLWKQVSYHLNEGKISNAISKVKHFAKKYGKDVTLGSMVAILPMLTAGAYHLGTKAPAPTVVHPQLVMAKPKETEAEKEAKRLRWERIRQEVKDQIKIKIPEKHKSNISQGKETQRDITQENIIKYPLGLKMKRMLPDPPPEPQVNITQGQAEPSEDQSDILELGRLAKHSERYVPISQKKKEGKGLQVKQLPSNPDPEGRGILGLGILAGMKKK